MKDYRQFAIKHKSTGRWLRQYFLSSEPEFYRTERNAKKRLGLLCHENGTGKLWTGRNSELVTPKHFEVIVFTVSEL